MVLFEHNDQQVPLEQKEILEQLDYCQQESLERLRSGMVLHGLLIVPIYLTLDEM